MCIRDRPVIHPQLYRQLVTHSVILSSFHTSTVSLSPIQSACHPSTTPPSACHPFSQPVILPHLYRQLVTHSVSLSSSHNSPPPPSLLSAPSVCQPLQFPRELVIHSVSLSPLLPQFPRQIVIHSVSPVIQYELHHSDSRSFTPSACQPHHCTSLLSCANCMHHSVGLSSITGSPDVDNKTVLAGLWIVRQTRQSLQSRWH